MSITNTQSTNNFANASNLASLKKGADILISPSPFLIRKSGQYCDFIGELSYLEDSDPNLSYCTLIVSNISTCTDANIASSPYRVSNITQNYKTFCDSIGAQFKVEYAYYNDTTRLREVSATMPGTQQDTYMNLSGTTCTLNNHILSIRVMINVDSASKKITWIKVLLYLGNTR